MPNNQYTKLTPIPKPNQYSVEDIRSGNIPKEAQDTVEKMKAVIKELAKNV